MKFRVYAIRKALKLSQDEFGKRIGVTRSAVSNYESGGRSITDQVALAICREYNVNEEWLRTGEGEMFIQTQEDELNEIAGRYNLDDMDRHILAAYLELPADARTVVKDYIHNVASRSACPVAAPDDRESLHRALDAELDAQKDGQTFEASPPGGLDFEESS